MFDKNFPYLLSPLTSLEAEIEAFNKKREFEKSVMSNFELKKARKDKTQKEFMESAQKGKDKLKLESEIINVKEKLDIWLKHKKLNFENQSMVDRKPCFLIVDFPFGPIP